jgi:hypothetical protein
MENAMQSTTTLQTMRLSLAGALFAAAAAATAQTPAPDPALAQQRYETALARCNSGTLPAPERDACVRDAGRMLDQTRGVSMSDTNVDSRDGRAVIVNPNGTPAPRGGDDTVTTGDGRAVIVLPADRTR